jgi:phosphoglycerate dehydrogenase-like enzyme
MTTRPKALFLLNTDAFHSIYGAAYADIAQLVDVYAEPQTAESAAANPDILREAEVIFSGWGCPTFDQTLLDHAPKLKVVFYGAGTIKQFVTPAFWERGIVITSAAAANAIPVAEYTLGHILLSLKGVWFYARAARESRTLTQRNGFPGGYGSTVGIISLGLIGRRVCELLKPFDLHVIAYDPYMSAAGANELGVEMCSLDELFRRADVVSLHTPWLPETEGLITGDHLRTMRPNSTFINTARGAVVRETEMITALAERQDITAILDVTYPEPPDAESPLFTLPNVMLTPHIAGALGAERGRLGALVLAELRRYLNGETLTHQVRREQVERMA